MKSWNCERKRRQAGVRTSSARRFGAEPREPLRGIERGQPALGGGVELLDDGLGGQGVRGARQLWRLRSEIARVGRHGRPRRGTVACTAESLRC